MLIPKFENRLILKKLDPEDPFKEQAKADEAASLQAFMRLAARDELVEAVEIQEIIEGIIIYTRI